RRTERRAAFLGLLDLDETVDDRTALHQQGMHFLVDAVDLATQLGEQAGVELGRFCFGHVGATYAGPGGEIKENIDRLPLQPIYPRHWSLREWSKPAPRLKRRIARARRTIRIRRWRASAVTGRSSSTLVWSSVRFRSPTRPTAPSIHN